MNTSGVVIPSEPSFIRTPLEYHELKGLDIDGLDNEQLDDFFEEQTALVLKRDIDSEEKMLDNLIDLIVYTPRGSFSSDPDFGFEFWNHEDDILYYNCSNKIPDSNLLDGKHLEDCQDSIKNSLHTYAPQLKEVRVEVILKIASNNSSEMTRPSYCFSIKIQGKRNDGIKDDIPYEYPLSFFIGPTIKKGIVSYR